MDTNCRECRAGLAQAAQMDIAWYCPEHGQMGLDVSSLVASSLKAPQLGAEIAQLRTLLKAAQEVESAARFVSRDWEDGKVTTNTRGAEVAHKALLDAIINCDVAYGLITPEQAERQRKAANNG